MKAEEVPMPVRIGVTAALAAATAAGATLPKDNTTKTGAGAAGALATLAYAWWAFKGTSEQTLAAPAATDNKMLTAVGVGVGATAAIATAMYFLGGREAPKMPSLGDVTGLAKREVGVGALRVLTGPDIPNQIRDHYDAKVDWIPSGASHVPHHYEYVENSDTGDITVTCRSGNTVTKDHWDCHRDSTGNCTYSGREGS